MKLQKIKFGLLMIFLMQVYSKFKLKSKIKIESHFKQKKNFSKEKFINNEGISLADVKFIINDKNQPKTKNGNEKQNS